MLGGLVIDFLQNITRLIATEGGSQQHVTPGSLPAPLYTAIKQDTASSECSRGDSLQDKAMYKLKWSWLEGKKPGWEADEDLATIFIAMDLPADRPPTHFSVGYLSSYQRTGLASVTCLGGCQCKQQNIRAHNDAQVRGPWRGVCLSTKHASCAGGAASATCSFVAAQVRGVYPFHKHAELPAWVCPQCKQHDLCSEPRESKRFISCLWWWQRVAMACPGGAPAQAPGRLHR